MARMLPHGGAFLTVDARCWETYHWRSKPIAKESASWSGIGMCSGPHRAPQRLPLVFFWGTASKAPSTSTEAILTNFFRSFNSQMKSVNSSKWFSVFLSRRYAYGHPVKPFPRSPMRRLCATVSSFFEWTFIREIGCLDSQRPAGFLGLPKKIRWVCSIEHGK